jgi:hypothetical protein
LPIRAIHPPTFESAFLFPKGKSMASVPTGTTFHVATAFAASKVVTAITNASEAVLTAVAHGLAVGDIVELTSGWGRLNLRAFRIKTVPTADTATLEEADTTNGTFFAAGGGVGSVRKVSTFTQITKITGVTSNGGDPNNLDYKYLESDVKFTMNDGFGATSYALDLDADAIGTAGYTALKNLTDVQTNTIMKIVQRNTSVQLLPCTVALNEAVQMQDGNINKVKAAFAGNNRLTRYATS